MLAALLVCAVTVLAAAAPGVWLAVRDLSRAQDRADAARFDTRATVLAHTLADERDDLAAFTAGGRSAAEGAGLPESSRSRADRQVRDVSAAAPADLRTALGTLSGVRQAALTGKGGPQSVISAYQPLIDALGRTGGPVTAPLGRAVTAAAVQRGLFVSALTAGGSQPRLTAAAQVAHVQEQAALAEFRATAPADLRRQYDQTVTGADTATADRDLAELLDGPQLTRADRALGAQPVNAALTARIGLMRTVEASSATEEARAAAHHRDHEVTVLELRSGLAALCLLVLLAVLVSVFRSVTRPLAALLRWSRSGSDSGQGVEVLGRDEFAAVARRVNALTQEAQALRARAAELGADRTRTLGVHSALSAERDGLLRRQDDLVRQLAAATVQGAAHVTYVQLSLRTLGLIERQLTLIEGLEDHEADPDRLETLFRLDHLATRMRRNSENLLVLTGTEHSHGATARAVPLVDVARAAISEIERYERVRIQVLATTRVAGRAADDVSHLIAELLDNATAFSAPTAEVHLSGWLLESGEVMLSVEDAGIGVPPERLGELNALLADPDPAPPGAVAGLGLYVVSRLARRHGVRVQLRPQKLGGTAAVVVLPRVLLSVPQPEDRPSTPVEAALAGEPLPLPAATPEDQPPAAEETQQLPAVPEFPAAPVPAAAPGGLPAEPVPAPTYGEQTAPVGQFAAEPSAAADDSLAAEPAPAATYGEQAASVGQFAAEPGPASGDAVVPAQAEHARPAPDGGPAAVPAATRSRHRRTPAPTEAGPVPAGAEPVRTGPASAAPPAAAGPAEPQPGGRPPAEYEQAVTGKGLPQRTPRSTGLTGEPAAREPLRGTPVDAEALRRKLGGLQRGLQAGRRDVEQELSTGATPGLGSGAEPGEGSGGGTDVHVQGDDQGDAGPANVEEATR